MKLNNATLDLPIPENKLIIVQQETHEETKELVLEPVGFPFTCTIIDTPTIDLKNEQLFEAYAQEQWDGNIVNEGSFLFDQKILPDFAFKIIKAEPENSQIGENTKISILESEITPEIPKSISNITMDDVIGQQQAKNKCKIIHKYLENPTKFNQWAPKNILFHGQPGTGKTMIAKALANEFNIPLYLIKATTLIGDHVGDGSRQIHDLFEIATKTAPSIIFLDEVDAIAINRKYQSLRGDVSEIVNALLTELDGIIGNEGVITIAATNNPLLLDHAVRSRFEEEIDFQLPTDQDRTQMIEKLIPTLPLKNNVPIEKLVKMSKGMSGRDIKEKLLKSALHHAISHDKEEINTPDFEFAIKNYLGKKNEPKGMYF